MRLQHFVPFPITPNPTLRDLVSERPAVTIFLPASSINPTRFHATNNILLGFNFYAKPELQNVFLLHELLHVFFDLRDHIALADKLELGAFTDEAIASDKITKFLQNDCRK